MGRTKMAQQLKKQKEGQSADKEVAVAINDNSRLVEIDLLQWMHLHRHQRCELLIDYARRPRKGSSKAKDKLMNYVPLHAMTVAKVGDMWLHAKKTVRIAPGTPLVLEDWKDDNAAVVITPAGEKVEIDALSLIENADSWITMI